MSKSNKSGIKTNMNPSKIIGIQFSLLSPEEIRNSSVAHITSRETYVNNKPVIGGLFDPRMGVLEPGLICPTDGLNYMETPGYFGHMELARPVFYIQYMTHIIKILRCICFKCSKLLIDKDQYKNALEMNAKERWDFVFDVIKKSKVTRCGDENFGGCGCIQPKKIKKEGLSTIIAEFDNIEGADTESGNIITKLSAEDVLKRFKRISDDDIEFMGFNTIFSRPEWMICQVLAVPPPAVRPSVKHDAQQRSEDDISHIIINIIKTNQSLMKKIKENADANVIETLTLVLQYNIATMVNNNLPGVNPVKQRSGRPLKSISERLNGKVGRVRGNLMGKRVDFSSRSVITADPNIGIRQLGVPKKIAMNLTYPVIVNARNKDFLTQLVKNGPEKYPGAKILERKTGESISLRYVDRETLNINYDDIVHRHILDGDAILFNRQPTLHRMSMMSHTVKVMERGNTFRMNVADTKPYNADFDGDEMNMHMPQDDEASSELRNLAAVPYQMISPANNATIVGIFQDSLLSAYRITRNHIKFNKRTAMNLLMYFNKVNKDIFKGDEEYISNLDVLSEILPPLTTKFANNSFDDSDDFKTSNNVVEIKNGQMIRGQFDKKIKNILHIIYNDFGESAAADFVDNLQNIVTEYMKTSSFSVGISDLLADKSTNEQITSAITKKKQSVQDLINQIQIGVFENNTGKSNNEEFETCINSILNKAQEEAGKIGRKNLSKNNRFKIMVDAGSKGSNLNIAQMISCLGQQNVDGKRIPYGFEDRTLPHYSKFDDSPESRGFVESSFIQGLTPQELYFHAMGGRVGLIDTAVKTSSTGYIQRQLVKGMEDLKIEYDMTVRNNMGKIIQYKYGGDSFDAIRVESQKLPLVEMSIEEIYSHYEIPYDDEILDEFYKVNYTEDTIVRFNEQREDLNIINSQYIQNMIQNRILLLKNVFNNKYETSVNMPINFNRIIENIKNQLGITQNSFVDITPLEMYNILENCKNNIDSFQYSKTNELFNILFNYYLTPKNLIYHNRFNKDAVNILCSVIETAYKKSLITPGEMVGIIAAQSIGEPTTQLTLNTFHFAGTSSKSNATRGVPRIKEILSLSKNPKNSSTTIILNDSSGTQEKAEQMRHIIEHTSLRDVVESVSICYDPDTLDTNIDDDKELIEQYNEFNKTFMFEDIESTVDKKNASNWIIRLVLDKVNMLDKNITVDDIHFCLTNGFKGQLECIFSDYNSDNLIFRIRLLDSKSKDTVETLLVDSQSKILDQTDQIYMIKNLQENLLDNIVLRGIKNISNVHIRKQQNDVKIENTNIKRVDNWVLDTVGTNLIDILAMDEVNTDLTFSNDIWEVYQTLGIEAARQTIYNELFEVMDHGGTYINHHHLSLLCDRMCASIGLIAITRHGINNDMIGPISKASFEETPEMFLRAARHGEIDNIRGVSANVMCGQEGNFGTSAFKVLLDMNLLASMSSKITKKHKSIEDEFGLEPDDDVCHIDNIKGSSNVSTIKAKNIGDDNDYELDF
jgi:DNA-directed RNA polymerase II subunit RPB1